MQPKELKQVMFEANDSLKHDVVWSEAGQCWMLENEAAGLIETYDGLPKALAAMLERVQTEPIYWTITDNPYGD